MSLGQKQPAREIRKYSINVVIKIDREFYVTNKITFRENEKI